MTTLFYDGFAGTSLDTTKWSSPSAFHCCGSSVSYDGHVRLPGDGYLHLEARKDATGHWHVPIIDTKGKHEFLHGLFEARIKVPVGKGLWPAFWLYGANSYEIDVTEVLANPPTSGDKDVRYDRIHVHWGTGQANQWGGGQQKTLPSKAKLSDAFHVYGADWRADHVTFYLDGVAIGTFKPSVASQIPPAALPLILNLGVGTTSTDWPGAADGTTPNPAVMLVDWVKVSS